MTTVGSAVTEMWHWMAFHTSCIWQFPWDWWLVAGTSKKGHYSENLQRPWRMTTYNCSQCNKGRIKDCGRSLFFSLHSDISRIEQVSLISLFCNSGRHQWQLSHFSRTYSYRYDNSWYEKNAAKMLKYVKWRTKGMDFIVSAFFLLFLGPMQSPSLNLVIWDIASDSSGAEFLNVFYIYFSVHWYIDGNLKNMFI